MPFRREPGDPPHLQAQIEREIRQRIREAVDRVSLEVLVRSRQARGAPAPAADSARDRREFEAGVRAFLERLGAELGAGLDGEPRRRLDQAAAGGGADPVSRLVAAQAFLARTLPDYWQRFEAIGAAHAAGSPPSGGQRGGLPGRRRGD